MPSRIYKIIKIQIGETEGTNGKKNKDMIEIGRLIEHEVRGNKWLSFQLTAAHLGPVLFQLAKPYMRRGSGSVDGTLYDPPQRKAVAANESTPPSESDPDASDWADPDAGGEA